MLLDFPSSAFLSYKNFYNLHPAHLEETCYSMQGSVTQFRCITYLGKLYSTKRRRVNSLGLGV